MLIKLKLFKKRLNVSYGLKEPDFITAKEMKQYSKKDELSKRMVNLNRKLTYLSKRFGVKEVYVKDLSQEDICLLERKGFDITFKMKSVKDEVTIVKNHYKVSLR